MAREDQSAEGKARKKPQRKYTPTRRGRVLRVSRVADNLVDRNLKAKGFAQVEIIKRWADIVGREMAQACQPVRLRFPTRERFDGVLTVRVEGAFATLLDHRTPQILDRINAYFGFKAVGKLALVHGPVNSLKPKPRKIIPPLEKEERHKLEQFLTSVGDDDLKQSLQRLGQAVMAGKRK